MKNQTADSREFDFEQEQSRLRELFKFERQWTKKGYKVIAGTDEAGRGPLAGPVVAAAVILPLKCRILFLNDSKKVNGQRRSEIFDEIHKQACAVSWCQISSDTIDAVNIYEASRLAMYKALSTLDKAFDLVLSDAMPLPQLPVPCVPIVHGDCLSANIAAASIVAKVVRDRIMEELDDQFPVYGFRRHKGYGTPEHIQALRCHGPCEIHRQSFEPVRSWDSHGDV